VVHNMLQVSHTCADHGKFMADLWTSAHQILGSILVHTKAQQEGYKALATALQNKDTAVTSACDQLQQELVKQHKVNTELRDHIKHLEKRLEQAEHALWEATKAKSHGE
jgi:septal ring factor EnvC (AmiA/AmiB activator)